MIKRIFLLVLLCNFLPHAYAQEDWWPKPTFYYSDVLAGQQGWPYLYLTLEEAAHASVKTTCTVVHRANDCVFQGIEKEPNIAQVYRALYIHPSNPYYPNLQGYGIVNGIWLCPARTRPIYAGWPRSLYCEPWDTTPPPPPRKTVVLDPGHGFHCPLYRMKIGAVGLTDFPPSDPPPGKLQEDNLTLAIALKAESKLNGSTYQVVLTKKDANSCPTFHERAMIANRHKAKAFVSIHINAMLTVPNTEIPIPYDVPYLMGTSVLYHSSNTPAKELAEKMAGTVSASLGLNNRGAIVADTVADVIKPQFTKVPAVLLEVGRLSGSDEKKLHAADSAEKTANGIKNALDAFIK